jgi:hypothetical protein
MTESESAVEIATQLKQLYGERFFCDYISRTRANNENNRNCRITEDQISPFIEDLTGFIRRQRTLRPSEAILRSIPHSLELLRNSDMKEKAIELLEQLGITLVPGSYNPSGLFILPRAPPSELNNPNFITNNASQRTLNDYMRPKTERKSILKNTYIPIIRHGGYIHKRKTKKNKEKNKIKKKKNTSKKQKKIRKKSK